MAFIKRKFIGISIGSMPTTGPSLVMTRLFGVNWRECSLLERLDSIFYFFFFFSSFFLSTWFQVPSASVFIRPMFVDFAPTKMLVGTHARLIGTLELSTEGLESSPHRTLVCLNVGTGCPLVVRSGTLPTHPESQW